MRRLLLALSLLALPAAAQAPPGNSAQSIKGNLYLNSEGNPYRQPVTIYLVPVIGRESLEQEIDYKGNEQDGFFDVPPRKDPPAAVLENDLIVKVKRWKDGTWAVGRLKLDKKPSSAATLNVIIAASGGQMTLSVKDPMGADAGAALEMPKM